MTFIASTSTGSSTGNNLPSISITLPSAGAGAAAGHFCIVGISGSINNTLSSSGWTQGDAQVSSNNGVLWFYKILVSGDLGATVVFGGGSTQRRSAIAMVFSNIDPATPINTSESPAAAIYNTASSTRAMPSTTLGGTRDVVTIVGDRNATSGPWTAGGTWNNVTGGYNTGSGGASGNMAYKESVPAGSVGGDNWTRVSGSATGAITMLVVLNPASTAYSSTGAISATDSLTGDGNLGKFGTGSLAASAALAATAVLGLSSTGAIAATAALSGSGNLGVSTTGSLAATSTLTGSGNLGKSSSGSLAITATLSGDGTVARTGTGAISETANLSGTGSAGYGGGGSIPATDSLTGSGVLGKSSTGSLAATCTLSGDGTVARFGSGTLSATASLTGDGATSGISSGSGSIAATGVLSGSGVLGKSTAGSLSETATLSGAGILGRYTSGSIPITVTLAGSGVRGASSAATLPLIAALAGDGTLGRTSTGALAATASLVGDGTVARNLGSTGTLTAVATLTGDGAVGHPATDRDVTATGVLIRNWHATLTDSNWAGDLDARGRTGTLTQPIHEGTLERTRRGHLDA